MSQYRHSPEGLKVTPRLQMPQVANDDTVNQDYRFKML